MKNLKFNSILFIDTNSNKNSFKPDKFYIHLSYNLLESK